jgi:outer membrane protein OmpA-like peptidoglycan-associated protein
MFPRIFYFAYFLFLPVLAYAQAGKPKNDTVVTLKCDGRFTLGAKNFRLMYGYPHPYSTSHFLVNVNTKIATNRPYLANTTYLKGTQKSWITHKATFTSMAYEFEGIKIIQRLIPVDKELNDLNGKNYTQYYRVEYDLINETNAEKRVGLVVLFDTQIADNDDCIMQTCKYENIRKGKSFLEKILALFSFSSQKRERAYYGSEIPEVVLVFKSEERHKDLTGAFILDARQATPPDEALIGRWTFYRSIRWAYPDPNKADVDYKDSALLLRWKERALPATAKRTHVTYYGALDVDTVGVKMTLPPDKSGTDFKIEPDTIFVGESAQLIWETKNPVKADVMVTGLRNKQLNKGTQKVNPFKTEVYTLRLVLDGKEIEVIERTLVVLPKGTKKPNNPTTNNQPTNNSKNNNQQTNKKITANEKKFDGRFTIGSEGKNLLFGYPYNYSTSHFVVQVGHKTASNDDELGQNSSYLSGKLTTSNEKGSPKTTIEYEFEGVKIVQKLVPMNMSLTEVSAGFGQYYWIEYTFVNNNTQAKDIHFALMLDAMIGTDDNAIVKQNSQKIALNSKLSGEEIPSSLFIFPAEGTSGATELIMGREKATKPDEILVGIWQHLSTEGYHPKHLHKIYTEDCALHLRWHKKTIKPKESTTLGVYLGNTTARLTALHHQQKASVQYDVFFEFSQYELTSESLETLAKVLERKDYAYLVIEGFTDKVGSPESNYALSQKRVQAVQNYLTENGIDTKRILIKSHGQHFAGKESDEKERRVSVIAFD